MSGPGRRPPAWRVLARAWRNRCPACGMGPVYEGGFRCRQRCRVCGWMLERGPGHWLGGSELNMLVSFPIATLAFLGVSAVWGFSPRTAIVGTLVAFVFSFWFLRRSRCLFYALDYLVDPVADQDDEPGDEWLRDFLDDLPDSGGPSGSARQAPALSSGRRGGSRPAPKPRSSKPSLP